MICSICGEFIKLFYNIQHTNMKRVVPVCMACGLEVEYKVRNGFNIYFRDLKKPSVRANAIKYLQSWN